MVVLEEKVSGFGLRTKKQREEKLVKVFLQSLELQRRSVGVAGK